MKKLTLAMSALLLLVVACNSEKKNVTADSTKTDTASVKPMDTAGMDKNWAAYMTPSTAHQMLAKANGKWDAEISFYHNPDSPTVDKTICENKMILGGRYQQSTYTGSLGGMPFEGVNTLAYDNSRKIYISTWVDNMGTGIMYLEGTYDEATKTMNMKGKAVDVTSGKDIQIRETMQFIDDNTHQMEMFDTKDGKEVKSVDFSVE